MAPHTTKAKPRVLLDASAWIAYARGSVDELEDTVEHSELLVFSLELPMIADHYVQQSLDPRPVLKYIESNAEILGVDAQVIERALHQGLAPNVGGLRQAMASLHDAQLVSVEDGRLVRSGAAR